MESYDRLVKLVESAAEDVAKAVYFLASPLADYITGTTIDVNGGLLMR